MDRRFVCRSCGVKWFVPSSAPASDDPSECSGCGGELDPLEREAGEGPLGWDGAITPNW